MWIILQSSVLVLEVNSTALLAFNLCPHARRIRSKLSDLLDLYFSAAALAFFHVLSLRCCWYHFTILRSHLEGADTQQARS